MTLIDLSDQFGQFWVPSDVLKNLKFGKQINHDNYSVANSW